MPPEGGTSVIFAQWVGKGILLIADLIRRNIPVINSVPDIRSSVPWVAAIVSAVGIAAICMRVFETDAVRAKRTERRRGKELRSLADKISEYAQGVHQCYPTGDVVVSV